MLSSILSAGCHTCHVTHTEQSLVMKELVPVSSVGPSSIPSCIIVTTVCMVCSDREGAGEQVHKCCDGNIIL